MPRRAITAALILLFPAIATMKAAAAPACIDAFQTARLTQALGKEPASQSLPRPVPHLRLTVDDKVVGYLFSTDDLRTSQQGYRKKGKVEVFILCAPDGRVVAIFMGNTIDTPRYIQRMAQGGLLKNWQGRQAGDKPPATISGATFTSRAVNKGVADALATLKRNQFFALAAKAHAPPPGQLR